MKAAFLDRDGVINIDKGYVHKIEDFEWVPGIFDLLKYLQENGYSIFIVTNQSGIGRGYFTKEDIEKLHAWMLDELKKRSIEIKEIRYCPHKPEDNCPCRKPKTKMFEELIEKYGIDTTRSIVIGDKERDVIPGKTLGCLTFRICHNDEESVADFKVKNLREIIEILEKIKDREDKLAQIKREHINALENTLSRYSLLILKIAHQIKEALDNGKKVLIAGNGGSAADAQHFAAELVVRFKRDRKALPCIALTTDTSILTACANDYSFDDVFSRQIEALGVEGDIFIAISTSGKSKNIIKAIEVAKNKGLKVFGVTGKDGGDMKDLCECIIVPSNETSVIQEVHEFILHFIARCVEDDYLEQR